MAESSDKSGVSISGLLNQMLKLQVEANQAMFGHFGQMLANPAAPSPASLTDAEQWTAVGQKLQAIWQGFQATESLRSDAPKVLTDPSAWLELVESWYRQMPLATPEQQQRLWLDGMKLWEGVLGQYGAGAQPSLPRSDRRFKDPRWQEQPVFALIHQTYLLFSEQLTQLAEQSEGLDADRKEQLRFATRTLIEALSPANFPLTNPVVLERTLETRGENLVQGMEHLLADLKRGQLTHTDSSAFELD